MLWRGEVEITTGQGKILASDTEKVTGLVINPAGKETPSEFRYSDGETVYRKLVTASEKTGLPILAWQVWDLVTNPNEPIEYLINVKRFKNGGCKPYILRKTGGSYSNSKKVKVNY